MKIVPASDSSLLVEFSNTVSEQMHRRVLALFQALLARRDPRIRNLHPGYASLLIDFDSLQLSHDQLAAHVQNLIDAETGAYSASSRTVEIPVCYDAEFGPDLGDVGAHNRISVEDVIRLHASATYLVYFLGFSPGFAYMGGLPEALRTPRLATPRSRVAAGSVGIAGEQTGIYPTNSAGGWRLIGRAPTRMFDAASNPPTRLQPGDMVRFTPITRSSFEELVKKQSI
jgi:KipI family sensor histidine kinase inhibitor